MARKKVKEPELIREFDMDELEAIMAEVKQFMYSGDDMYIDRSTLTLKIFDDGTLEVGGDFTGYSYQRLLV